MTVSRKAIVLDDVFSDFTCILHCHFAGTYSTVIRCQIIFDVRMSLVNLLYRVISYQFNISRQRQNGRHFADDIFKLVLPMVVNLLTHICITRCQRVDHVNRVALIGGD